MFLSAQQRRRMKKVLKSFLSLSFVISAVLFSFSSPIQKIVSTDGIRNVENVTKPYGNVTIGTPSFDGNLIDGFGNSPYDGIVRNMIWGYSTYTTTPGGEVVLDTTVIKKLTTSNDKYGNRTYTFELNPSLKWSDGTVITADDYVFSLLLMASPEWKTAGAVSSIGRELLGYYSYNNGSSKIFSGVKKINSTTFSLTIDSSNTPYFYETLYVAIKPSPLHVWGKGVTIGTDGSSLVGDLVNQQIMW